MQEAPKNAVEAILDGYSKDQLHQEAYNLAKHVAESIDMFPQWELYLGHDSDRLYYQVQFYALDTYTQKPALQQSRKWVLSPYMSETELVTTAYKAFMAAVEHEARETFMYEGRRIFNPHINVHDLIDLVDNCRMDYRK